MIDLTTIPDAEKIRCGEASIVAFAHKDALKALQEHCNALSVLCAKVLTAAQTDLDNVGARLIEAQAKLDDVTASAALVESLARQKAELRGKP